MDNLISRQAAINEIRETSPAFFSAYRHDVYIDKQDAIARLMALSPASKQKKGKWGKWIGKPIAGYATVRCSVCNDVFCENTGEWNFCPNCGADMREDDEEE